MKYAMIFAAAVMVGHNAVHALPQELLDNPHPETARFYSENALLIDGLLAELKSAVDPGLRSKAFYRLIKEYPEAATIAARDYVVDSDAHVANTAIAVLMNALVMTNHHHGPMDRMPPKLRYIMASNHKSRIALRKALEHPDKKVRLPVAKYFASQSDTQALDIVQAGVEKGLYTEDDAAKIFTLPNGRVATRYLEPYLEGGDTSARETAIAALGFYPQYQDKIRASYFANARAPVALRKQAANVLGKYDRRFAEYALTVATEDDVPAAVFAPTMASYVESLSQKRLLDPQTAQKLNSKIKAFLANNPRLEVERGGNDKLILDRVLKKLEVEGRGGYSVR